MLGETYGDMWTVRNCVRCLLSQLETLSLGVLTISLLTIH